MTLLLHGGELVVTFMFCPMHTVFFYIYYIDLARAINASLSKQSALSENGAIKGWQYSFSVFQVYLYAEFVANKFIFVNPR